MRLLRWCEHTMAGLGAGALAGLVLHRLNERKNRGTSPRAHRPG